MPNAIRTFLREFNAGCLSSYPSCPPYCASTSLSGVIGPWRGGSSPAVTYMQRAQSSPFTLRQAQGERFASDSKQCFSASPPLLPYAISTLFRRYLPVARGLVPRCRMKTMGSVFAVRPSALRQAQGERFASDSKRCLSAIPPLLPYAVSTLFRRYLRVARGLIPRCRMKTMGSVFAVHPSTLRQAQGERVGLTPSNRIAALPPLLP